MPSPFAGATDLNDDRATETLGILFMEGQGEPAEITRLKADLGVLAEAYRSTGQWLTAAMEAGWGVAEALLRYPELADQRVVPRYLFSASEMLDHAADLAAHSAVLTHENERRWRIFHQRVQQIISARG